MHGQQNIKNFNCVFFILVINQLDAQNAPEGHLQSVMIPEAV